MRFTAICLVVLIITAIGIVIARDNSVPDGTIYGHVYDAQTKQPISQAWVYCQETECQKQTTDRDGYYSIENCFSPSSTYVIECTKNGYKSIKNTATTDSSGKANVDFSLELISSGDSAQKMPVVENSDSLQPTPEDQKVEATPNSEKASGSGSLRKEYHISNKANDYANVSLDIKNASYYEYEYSTYSDESQCHADLNLVVDNAESITCSGGAKNRNNIPADITTLTKNGNITCSNSFAASNQGIQASQNIIKANGDSIDIRGNAVGDNSTHIENIITAYHSEGFNGTQKVSVGRDTITNTSVNAMAGPLVVSSLIIGEGRTLKATSNVAAGMATINQSVNLADANQYCKGAIGGANFDTSIETAIGNKTHVYATTGSGNVDSLLQHASVTDAHYEMEYEYMPVSYQTGTYDTAYASCGSDVGSNNRAANVLLADHCEHLQVAQDTNLSRDAVTHTNLGAIAGPLDVISFIAAGGTILNTTANVVAGVVDINQSANLTDAYQSCKGVTGGANFEISIDDAIGNKTHVNATTGSGNVDSLLQHASVADARYEMEYEYMPVSYQTGTYDIGYASGGSDVGSDKRSANVLLADHCEHLQVAQETNLSKDAITNTSLNAIAGPLDVTSSIVAEGRTLNATANVVAGVVYINQSVNLTDAYQNSKGVAGGAIFYSSITNADRKTTRAFTMIGSGNIINLSQIASLEDARYNVEYGYMPVSYQTGTYDVDLNTSKIERY